MKHVRESIQAFVSGDLDRERSREVQAHLGVCPECRRVAEQVRDTWDLLGAAAAEPAAGGSIWPEVRRRTVGRSDHARDWFFGHGAWSRSALATAAVAAGLVIGVLIPAGQSPDAFALDQEEDAWLTEATWTSEGGMTGLADVILGLATDEQENGS
jgi:anti-sigma factor RsiW